MAKRPRSVPLFTPGAGAILTSSEIRVLHHGSFVIREQEEEKGQEQVPHPQLSLTTPSDPHCVSCLVSFSTREEQIEHYRLDWHRCNLKRRMKGQAAVNQDEFERIAGDLSSISGSESSSDSDVDTRTETVQDRQVDLSGSPFVYFTTADSTQHAVYRCLVMDRKSCPSHSILIDSLQSLAKEQTWIILMKAGGHFAGAVFRGSNLLAHKTFHRYTVRAKRGTSQSVRDAQGHKPKSAGASLRRYNEAALENEIQTLITSWSQYVQEATHIFVRTPKHDWNIFVGGKKSPFSRDDNRLRTIPFATRRPTLAEVKAVHSKLAAVYGGSLDSRLGHEPVSREHVGSQPVSKEQKEGDGKDVNEVKNREGERMEDIPSGDEGGSKEERGGGRKRKQRLKKVRERKGDTEEELPDDIHELLEVCRGRGCRSLTKQLAAMGLRAVYTDGVPQGEERTDDHSPPLVLNKLYGDQTPLHVASESGQADITECLLQYGASPSIRNSLGHTPYFVAKDKSVRDVFRRFMARFPSVHDYEAAGVPSPLTEDMERTRKDKMTEKKRAQRKARKVRESKKKSEQELERLERVRTEAVSSLSDREKRAMAAEQRMAHQLPLSSCVQRAGVCSFCGGGLAGVVPFERLSYKYCSMTCVKHHRQKLNTT